MLEKGLDYRVDSHVAHLVIDNQRASNSLNPAMLSCAETLLASACADSDIRALVLSARGPVFCNGMDFQLMSDAHEEEGAASNAANRAADTASRAAAQQFTRFLTTMRDFPKPVCSIVSGQVRAGGVGIVAASDIVLAATSARFELSELLFGLLPAVVLPFLLERISLKSARYLCITAHNLSATEAAQIGLVDQLTEDGVALARASKTVLRQLLRMNPAAIPRLKHYTDCLSAMPRFTQRTRLAQKLLTTLLRDRKTQSVIRTFTDEGMAPPWFASYHPTNMEKRIE